MTRRTLLTLTASPLLRASDPFEDRWRAVADRVIGGRAESYTFEPAHAQLMLALMRLYQRTKYLLYADFVEAWARHSIGSAAPSATAGHAVLLLGESRHDAMFERYVAAAAGAESLSNAASFLARYGMVRRRPALILRAASSVSLTPPLSPSEILTIADVLEALEPMQPDYEPLARATQVLKPTASDPLSLAAAWKLVRIQVLPAARSRDALEEWRLLHNRPEPDAIAPYLMAAAEAAATL